eukprot:jgi/Tetstr1/444579/TSEL_032430.t1
MSDRRIESCRSSLNLEAYEVGTLPTVYYVPDYVSEAEEGQILREIRSSKCKWTQVSGRRLQNHGGLVHSKGWLIQQALPSWLQRYTERMAREIDVFGDGQAPNHVLVNSYQPGEGILPHEDGPLYQADVCILSLGAPAVLRFQRKPADGDSSGEPVEQASVACLPRSLLIFSDDAYTDCLHGIDAAEVEQLDDTLMNTQATGLKPGDALPRAGERISLTARRVLKVKKNLLKL